jgi:hypothetical protein
MIERFVPSMQMDAPRRESDAKTRKVRRLSAEHRDANSCIIHKGRGRDLYFMSVIMITACQGQVPSRSELYMLVCDLSALLSLGLRPN